MERVRSDFFFFWPCLARTIITLIQTRQNGLFIFRRASFDGLLHRLGSFDGGSRAICLPRLTGTGCGILLAKPADPTCIHAQRWSSKQALLVRII